MTERGSEGGQKGQKGKIGAGRDDGGRKGGMRGAGREE